MSEITAVLRSTTPDQIALWKSRYELSYRRWKARVEQTMKELHISDPVVRTDFSSCWIVGYRNSDGATPKLGFKRDKKTGYVIPDTFSTEGKRVEQTLATLRYSIGGVPGIPDAIQGVKHVGQFHIEKHGAEWFAVLRIQITKSSLKEVDSTLWKRISLEEFSKIVQDSEKSVSRELFQEAR